MGTCPACDSTPLSSYQASPGIEVELCTQCRGLFLDREEIRSLVGRGSLAKATEVVPVSLGEPVGMACPKCVEPAMQPLQVKGAEEAQSWQCRSCGGLWLEDGVFFVLARALRSAGQSRPAGSASQAADLGRRSGETGWRAAAAGLRDAVRGSSADDPGVGLAFSRSSFDVGLENLVGVPIVLLLSALFCSTVFGRFLASLVGMPFHELGHAAASWLSSRIAVPLPFFTFWYEDQSIFMGLLVAGILGWLLFHTHREKNRFMFGASSVLLVTWAVITFLVPRNETLMWQILAGVLGEIILGAFFLVAFHFPLPDRFRWDFWRWIAIVPASLCFVHAIVLWREVAADVSQMPWGSAVGDESDGDMNRLVQQFGWSANELADLYLSTAYLGVAAIVIAYAYAVYRLALKKKALTPSRA